MTQSDPIPCPQNQKGKIYKDWQFTKGTYGKPSEQLFPRQEATQLP